MLAHVLIHAVDATLEDRKITLNGIRVSIAPYVLIRRMDDGPMARKPLPDFPIDAALIRAEVRIGRECFGNYRLQRSGGHVRDVVRSDPAATFHQRHDCFLRRRLAISAVARLATDECLVRLNEFTS